MPESLIIGADTPPGRMISASSWPDERGTTTTAARVSSSDGAETTAASRNGAAVGSSPHTARGVASVAAPNAPPSRSCCRQA